MNKLRLGIIGVSDGNGHPYSWSAIFNGYDHAEMEKCPFPVIPDYLNKQKFPEDFLVDLAEVTHIWTQDIDESNRIARASKIPTVVEQVTDMVDQVDAVLLARDDAENHLHYAKPILEAGIPVYIDKPLAHSVKQAKHLFELQTYDAQIFSCSALRYAKEFTEIKGIEKIGSIRLINAFIPKSWEKYGIHIIEPVVALINKLGDSIIPDKEGLVTGKHTNHLTLKTKSGTVLTFNTLGDTQVAISIELIGEQGRLNLNFKDTFYAFRESLRAFVKQVKEQKNQIERSETLQVVNIIELGLN
jgi:hypothetical protein